METKIIATPSGQHQVEYKAFITGREVRQLNNSVGKDIKGIKFNEDGSTDLGDAISEDFLGKMEDTKLRTIIVSIDGHKQGDEVDDGNGQILPFDIAEAVLNMSAADYKEVMAIVKNIENGKEAAAIKKD